MELKNALSYKIKTVLEIIINSKCELIMFVCAIGFYAPAVFVPTLLVQKLCLQKNYSTEYCTSNHINGTLEETLQGEATHLLLYHNLIKQLPSIILPFFMGQWSDLYGRKYILFISLTGMLLTTLMYLLNAIYMEWPAIFVVLAAIPTGLGGDTQTFVFALNGFLRDSHTMESLSSRVSSLQGTQSVSAELAPVIANILYQTFSYPGVFLLCLALFMLGFVSIAIFVKDDKFEKSDSACQMARNFFRVSGCISCFTTVFKKRKGNLRPYIVCVLISFLITAFQVSGIAQIAYLYARLKLHWDVTMMNYYLLDLSAMKSISCYILLSIFVRFFHWSDINIGLLGHAFSAAFFYCLAAVVTTVGIYCVTLLQLIAAFGSIAFYSIIMKCVPIQEIGKILAVSAILQSVSINFSEPLVNQIYYLTFKFFPGAVFIFTGSLTFICIALYSWISIDMRRNRIILEKICDEE